MAKKKKKKIKRKNKKSSQTIKKDPILEFIKDWDKVTIDDLDTSLDSSEIKEIKLISNKFVLLLSDQTFARVEKVNDKVRIVVSHKVDMMNFKYIDFVEVLMNLSYPFDKDIKATDFVLQVIDSETELEKIIKYITYISLEALKIITYRLKHKRVIYKEKSEYKNNTYNKNIIKNGADNQNIIDVSKDIVIYTSRKPLEEKRKYNSTNTPFKRRGHYRTLKSGKKIWIEPTIVNKDKGSDNKLSGKIYKV